MPEYEADHNIVLDDADQYESSLQYARPEHMNDHMTMLADAKQDGKSLQYA